MRIEMDIWTSHYVVDRVVLNGQFSFFIVFKFFNTKCPRYIVVVSSSSQPTIGHIKY